MKQLSRQVHRFFDIREGELSVSLWMQFYIFLIICALLIVKPTVNALFLSTQGADSLAVAFIITAVVAVVISYAYNKTLEHYPLRHTIRGTLYLFGVGFAAIGLCVFLEIRSAWLSYIFYIMVGMFALLTTSQFWVMANVVFNVREAKRLFGFIGAGGIVGGIAGGYITSILAQYVGNGILILGAAVMVGGCAFVFERIWKDRVQNLTRYKRKERANVSSESSIKLIWDSEHLSYLAAVIGIGVLVAKLVDYQFSVVVHREIPDAQELASFFGFWFSSFNIASLAIQLFLTRHILERTDIGLGLILLPVGVISCSALLIFFPELWLVILLKGFDGSLKQSLYKSSVELLALPIPSDVKNKTKTFIDVVVDSIATGFAGFFIIFIIKGLELPTYAITILTILLVIGWIFIVFRVRHTYLGTFRDSILNSENVEKRRKTTRQIRDSMRRTFELGDPGSIIKVLQRVPEVAHSSLAAPIIKLIEHQDHRVKAAAIDILPYVTKQTQPQIQDLISVRDDELIVSVMEYLLSKDRTSYQFFEQYLDDEDDFISSAALLALAHDARDNPRLASKYNLGLRVKLYIDELEAADNDLRVADIARLIETLGYVTGTKYHDLIIKYLKHKNPILVNAAIVAAGEQAHERFLPLLMELLEDHRFRESVMTAISKYGNSILRFLEQEYDDPNTKSIIKQHLPKIVARLKTERAYRTLVRISLKGGALPRTIATELLYKWRKAGSSYPVRISSLRKAISTEIGMFDTLLTCYYSLRIINKKVGIHGTTQRQHLINQIYSSQELTLKRVFNRLSLYYDPDDVLIAYKGLVSETRESKLNAIEYLDGMLGRNLKTLLFPVLENGFISPEDVKNFSSRISLKSEEEVCRLLINIKDREIHLKLIDLLEQIPEEFSTELLLVFTNDSSKTLLIKAADAFKTREELEKTT
ncbi:MAG: Npt1/Npt2 family nucleotide transporter [Nonlabens sp.]